MNQKGASTIAGRGPWAALAACLLDYEAFPGRYPLGLREPRLLFDHGHEMLALASGRAVEGLPQDAALERRLRQAARFFVRTAMLRPGTDHYTLMGLAMAFTPTQLRDHYRMLMRLTHPDFVGEDRSWPQDAAARINQANDVLSSVVARADYDRGLRGAGARPRPVPPAADRRSAGRPLRARGENRMPRGDSRARRGMGLGVLTAGVLSLGVLLFWGTGGSDDDHRVAIAPDTSAGMPGPAGAPVPLGSPSVPNLASAPTPVPRPIEPALPAAQAAMTKGHPAAPADAGGPLLADRAQPTASVEPPLALRAASGLAVSRAAPAANLVVSPASQVGVFPVAPTSASGSNLSISLPAPSPVAAAAPASVALAGGAQGAAPGQHYSPTAAPNPIRPTMSEVQPLLGNILAAMQSGRGEQVLRWVERPARAGDGADGFVQTYNRAVANARSVRLGEVRFSGRPGEDALLVDGVVLLHIQDENQHSSTQELVLRAQFATRDGQAVLTRLNASETAR